MDQISRVRLDIFEKIDIKGHSWWSRLLGLQPRVLLAWQRRNITLVIDGHIKTVEHGDDIIGVLISKLPNRQTNVSTDHLCKNEIAVMDLLERKTIDENSDEL